MDVEKIVLFKEDWSNKPDNVLTLRNVLSNLAGSVLAGNRHLEEVLSSPEDVLEQLRSVEDDYCSALLFCADVQKHENGSEYVLALRLKKRSELTTEKYFLDDPMVPSFTIALIE